MHSEIIDKGLRNYGLEPEKLGVIELGYIGVLLPSKSESLRKYGMNPRALTEFDIAYLDILIQQRQRELMTKTGGNK